VFHFHIYGIHLAVSEHGSTNTNVGFLKARVIFTSFCCDERFRQTVGDVLILPAADKIIVTAKFNKMRAMNPHQQFHHGGGFIYGRTWFGYHLINIHAIKFDFTTL